MNESTDTIQQMMEALQVWSYGRLGRDPTEIPEHLDLLRYRQREFYTNSIPAPQVHAAIRAAPEVTDPTYRAQMDRFYSKFRTTAYQDPVILGGIAHSIDDIAQAAKELYPDAAQALEPPLVATVPISLLNAFAMQDASGRSGIVLQDGLRFMPLLMASEIGRHLFVPHPQGVGVSIDADALKARLGTSTEWSDRLMSTFVLDASDPHMVGPPEERQAEIQASEAVHGYRAIEAGFQTFIVAHEYAHCLKRHIDQLSAESGPRLARHVDFIRKTIELAHQKYPHLEDTRDQRHAFAFLHPLEFEADMVALKLLIKILTDTVEDEVVRHMRIMGALAFFWYAEIMERVHRTIETGSDWFDNELYTKDFHVQSLLLRSSHPAPLERAHMLLRMAYHEPVDEWVKMAVLGCWVWLETFFELAWAGTRPVMAASVAIRHLKMDRKWVDEIPLHLAAIGIRSH